MVTMTDKMPDLLTKKDVAEWLSCSVRSVDTLRVSSGLPYILLGRLVRFRRKDIQEWLDAQHTIRKEEAYGVSD